jgi:hypothetical protein
MFPRLEPIQRPGTQQLPEKIQAVDREARSQETDTKNCPYDLRHDRGGGMAKLQL